MGVSFILSGAIQVKNNEVDTYSNSDRRQFTQVTLSAEAKNTAGKKLAAGTPVWTVSDQGSLLAASSAVPVPSWWAKCSPAYGNQTGAGVECTARTKWQFYLSSDDVLEGNKAGSLTAGFPLMYGPDNAGQQMTRPAKNKNEAARIFSLLTLGRNVGKMKKGDRVWVVSDGDSLTKTAQAAAGGEPKCGEVVIPAAPAEINAGDSIGHMGFYELPEEDGKQSRYQVHIECLSMDSKLTTFLTNPDKVGGDSPTFLKYPEGANLFAGNAEGAMVDTKRVTRAPGILTLSGVPVIRADEVVTHYQIHPEGGWLPAANIIKLPQWALGDLGFVTLDSKPESFDLIDGKKQPDNVVKGILAEMYKAAKADPRTGSALYHYNYERLLKQIDRNNDGQFSEEEYIQAIRLPAYRDHLYRIIAKHPSEWWYGKDDALWKKYLDTLAKDAPSWKTYLETFIDRLTWMKSVAGMGPDPWHMHPVVFLEALKDGEQCKISVELIENLLGHENKWFTGKSGGKTFAKHFQTNYPEVFEFDKQEFVDLLNRIMKEYGITGNFHKAHFLSQCLHESSHLDTTLEFGSGKNYDPGTHPDASKYENTVVGDGPKYRGRGLIQLTWKKNYRLFSEFSGGDFLTEPELIAGDMESTIKASAWFWRNNGGIYKKFDANGDINVLIDNDENNVNLITKAVNGGANGLAERQKYFDDIKKFWGLKC
jgi:predicted chitinase